MDWHEKRAISFFQKKRTIFLFVSAVAALLIIAYFFTSFNVRSDPGLLLLLLVIVVLLTLAPFGLFSYELKREKRIPRLSIAEDIFTIEAINPSLKKTFALKRIHAIFINTSGIVFISQSPSETEDLLSRFNFFYAKLEGPITPENIQPAPKPDERFKTILSTNTSFMHSISDRGFAEAALIDVNGFLSFCQEHLKMTLEPYANGPIRYLLLLRNTKYQKE